jgi:hypothetical protein
VDHADAALEKSLTISLNQVNVLPELLEPIIQISNPNVRISSLRIRKDTVLVTVYNMTSKEIEISAELADRIATLAEVKIDGSIIKEYTVSGKRTSLIFNPHEIKMCILKPNE